MVMVTGGVVPSAAAPSAAAAASAAVRVAARRTRDTRAGDYALFANLLRRSSRRIYLLSLRLSLLSLPSKATLL